MAVLESDFKWRRARNNGFDTHRPLVAIHHKAYRAAYAQPLGRVAEAIHTMIIGIAPRIPTEGILNR